MARPRSFDIDRATDTALRLFWLNGYEGTTIGELSKALKLNRPSIYAAFGSKEGLFQRALERYLKGPGAGVAEALSLPRARDAVEGVLRFYADAAAVPGQPKGCFLVSGAMVCGEESLPARDALRVARGVVEQALTDRLKQAKRADDLPAGEKPAELARYVMTVCHGLSVQAVSGVSRDQLRQVVEHTMRAWPLGD